MNNQVLRNALVTFTSFIFVITVVSAWTAPTQAPANGNVPAPITVGGNQSKSGGLWLASLSTAGGASIGTNAGADQLCLNGACITTWPSGSGTGDNLGNHTATQNINMSGSQVTNLGTPVNATDSATKGYVDGKIGSNFGGSYLDVKSSRALNVEYVNTNSNPRFVIVAGNTGSSVVRAFLFAYVNGERIQQVPITDANFNEGWLSSPNSLSFIVPPGARYKVDKGGSTPPVTVSSWYELN